MQYQTVQLEKRHQPEQPQPGLQFKHHVKDLSKGSTIDLSTASVDHNTAIAHSEFKYGDAVRPSVNRVRTFTPIGDKSTSYRQISQPTLDELFKCCKGAQLLQSSQRTGTCTICGTFFYKEVSENAQF
jgi:5-methylcytosine-specific restriction endonuclease McrA